MTVTFPINFNALRVALVKEVQRITKLTCIMLEPETQNAPRPGKPYFTLKMLGPAGKQGDDAATNVLDNFGNPTTVWNRGGQRKMTVDFSCYGCTHEQAYDYMALWQASLELETTQENLRRAGIAVWLNGSVRDLSVLLNSGFEGRAQMEVQFGIASNLDEDLGGIQTIYIDGTADTGSEEIPISTEIILPS